MQLMFKEEKIELENPIQTEEVIEKINDLLGKVYYFSHLIADEEITDSPEYYLLENVRKIEELEIIAVEAKEFINGLLLSTEEYTERAIPHFKDISDAFAHQPTSDSWFMFTLNELLEGVQWLATMITTVEQPIVRPENWGSVVEQAANLESEARKL